jgi:hypothetical protein
MNIPNNTIQVKFDPKSLPAWARKHPEVVELCKINLGFRCDVNSATSAAYRRYLIRFARSLASRI